MSLTVKKLSQDHMHYFLSLAACCAYYLGNGEPAGLYLATEGASYLRLTGMVTEHQLGSLFKGVSPHDGHAFVANAGLPSRVPGIDLCISMPKSLSVWIAMVNPGLREHTRRIILEVIEKFIQESIENKLVLARCGKAGRHQVPAKMVAIAFEHSWSRLYDMQWHWHLICPSLTITPDGKTRALEPKLLFQYQKNLQQKVFAAIAKRLETEIGLKTIKTKHNFEIAGVPKHVCDHFSKRRKEILAYLAQRGLDTSTSGEIANLATRKPKRLDLNRKDLIPIWQDIGRRLGFGPEHAEKLVQSLGHSAEPSHDLIPDHTVVNPRLTNEPAIDWDHVVEQGLQESFDSMHESTVHMNALKSLYEDDPVLLSDPLRSEQPVPDDRPAEHANGNGPATPSQRTDGRDTVPWVEVRYIKPRHDPLLSTVKSMSSDAPAQKPKGFDAVIDQWKQPIEYTYGKSLARDIYRMAQSGKYSVSSRHQKSVFRHYSKRRSLISEELRHHFRQLKRAAMKKETENIDRKRLPKYAKFVLNDVHREVVKKITSDPSRISVLRHSTRYNKFWAIRVSRDVFQRAGYQVLGVALSRDGAHRMNRHIGLDTVTLKRLELMMKPTIAYRLKHHARQFLRAARRRRTYSLKPLKIKKGMVLVVEAADSMNNSQLSSLIEHVNRYGGKIILMESDEGNKNKKTPFYRIASYLKKIRPKLKQEPETRLQRAVSYVRETISPTRKLNQEIKSTQEQEIQP